jgi:phosphatidyl-myo-inositol alpha-mannosyltransferase
LRILLVSGYDLTHAGGVTSHVLDLADQFERMGHQVTVSGPSGDGELAQNENTYFVGSSFRWLSPGDAARINLNPLVSRQVRAFLKGRSFDVVHLHEPFLGFIGPSFLRHADGIKVGTFHTWREGPHLPYIGFWPLVMNWNRMLDGRIAVSEAARKTINRYVRSDYRVIPNGVDFRFFTCPVEPVAHLADDRPTILFVGRIEARKGLPYLFQAYERVKAQVPDARLVLVGNGGLRAEYEQLVQKMGLGDVHFEGYVARERLPAYYQRADVFCSPSTVNEAFGITLLEAMSAHTPVVATSINGSNTVGAHGVNGLIVPPKEPVAMADAVLRILEDKAFAGSLADAAQVRARQFDWEAVAQSLIDYYVELGA